MLTKRIIACLDVRDGTVVKGVRFNGLAAAGDPAALAARYNDEGFDEIMLLDVTATLESRSTMRDAVTRTAAALFIPLGVGGGVRSLDDAMRLFDWGADKVAINSAALERPSLITELSLRYGAQAVVVAIDVKGRTVYARSGTCSAHREAADWAREAADRGAGEILLTSIDRDGTREGFDCAITREVATAVPIPVIASGGAGTIAHFGEVFGAGAADAALAASIFHFGEISIRDLKRTLASQGVQVREVRPC